MIALGIDPDTKTPALAVVSIDIGVALVRHVAIADCTRRYPGGPPATDVNQRLLAAPSEIEIAMLRFGVPIIDGGHIDVVVIEGQDAYAGAKRHARPNDLIHLAQFAGVALGVAHKLLPGKSWMVPSPHQWKGSVPKSIHQSRILGRVNLTPDLVGVPGAQSMTKAQKGHCIDAIGLALWGLEQAGATVPRPRRYGA